MGKHCDKTLWLQCLVIVSHYHTSDFESACISLLSSHPHFRQLSSSLTGWVQSCVDTVESERQGVDLLRYQAAVVRKAKEGKGEDLGVKWSLLLFAVIADHPSLSWSLPSLLRTMVGLLHFMPTLRFEQIGSLAFSSLQLCISLTGLVWFGLLLVYI